MFIYFSTVFRQRSHSSFSELIFELHDILTSKFQWSTGRLLAVSVTFYQTRIEIGNRIALNSIIGETGIQLPCEESGKWSFRGY